MKNKKKFIIFDLEPTKTFKTFDVKHVGDFNLSVDDLRDTIKDNLDIAFDNLKEKINNSEKDLNIGICIMPWIKIVHSETGDFPNIKKPKK